MLLVGLLALAASTLASAQSAPVITDGGVENRFPEGMTFRVSAESDSDIEEIRLRYTIQPDGTAARGVPEFDPANSVEAELALEQPKVHLPPGTVIEYYWEVTDADGDTSETDVQSFFYDDVRFDWETVSGDGVTIYYYSGGEDAARDMHEAALESIGEMSSLLQTEIPFEVQVWIYESPDDMRPALRPLSNERDSSVITAGVRVATNTVLVLGNASFDTLRHELTHIVTAEAGEGAFGGFLPFWLDEGTAVYSQEDKGWFEDAINTAIRRGEVFSVRQVTTIAGDPDNIALYYGQGWSLVDYLIETHGADRFAQLYAEMKSGSRVDSALEAVYGFDQDALEDEWREHHDLPPRTTPAPEQPLPGDAESGDDGGASAGLLIGLAVAILALAGAIVAGGITLARRM